ncbi:MAG: TolC family protein [Chitinophagaceae bacterium]|nr:TolC family protein [Chitinophagaceae bacterium]
MRRLMLVILMGFFSGTYAQSILTAEESVALALRSNYDILLVRNDSAAYALDYSYANYAFFPRLNGSVSKLWNTNHQKQELSDGTKRDRKGIKSNNLVSSVNLNWTLFDGLKMFATRDKLAEFKRLGDLSVRNQVVTTVATILTTYYNIVRQQQQLRAIEEQMSIDEERVKIADRKFSVGLGSKPELLQAKVDLNAQKAAQLQQQTLIVQLKEQLNQLIGQSTGKYFEVTDSIPIDLDINLGIINTNLESTNPTLLVALKNIDIANITLKERKAERWPTISFNSAYNFSNSNNQAVINTFTPLFNQNNGYNFGFSASVPIFNGFNARRLIKQAELDIQYQQLFFENQRSLINTGISNAFKDYQYQKRALVLEEENIQLAKENVAIALERFRQGVSTNLELREAQISLQDAYNRLIAARYNTKLAEIELLRLKGDIVR